MCSTSRRPVGLVSLSNEERQYDPVRSMSEVLGREAPCLLSFALKALDARRTIKSSQKPKPEDVVEVSSEDARMK
jgi:hypothetical protein